MQSHTYPVQFEEFPAANGDWLDGNLIINATRFDWEIVGAEVFAGRDGMVLVKIADHDLINQLRDYFMARQSWVDLADIEHRAYFPTPSARPRLVPAYVE